MKNAIVRDKIMPRPGVANICFLIAIGALIVVQMPGIANDPGLGWHLAGGSWSLRNFAVPYQDPFLYSPEPRAWISDQWFSDVIFSAVYSLGNWPLLYTFITALFVATFFILLYPQVKRQSGLALPSALAALYAFKISQVHFILRPVVLSFPFFASVYLLLLRNERSNLSHAFKLALIFLVWANVHPSFVLGLFIVGLWTITSCISLWRSTGKIFFSIPAVFLLCCAVTLLNPYGFAMHRSVLALGGSPFFMSLHEEWKSPNLADYEGQLLLLGAIVVFAGVILCPRARRKMGLFALASWGCFLMFSIDAVRMLPYFGIASAFPLAVSIGEFAGRAVRKFTLGNLISRRCMGLERLERTAYPGERVAEACLVLLVVLAVAGIFPFQPPRPGPSPDSFPYGAVSFLTTEFNVKPIVVLSHPNWGGFLTWFGKGELKPLIDDRNTLVGENFYQAYFERLKGPEKALKSFMKEYDCRFILLPAGAGPAARLSASREFRVLFKDDTSILFEGIDD